MNDGMYYSCVSRGSVILSRYAAFVGNFPEVTEALLEKLVPSPGEKKSLTLPPDQQHVIHYFQSENNLIFLCMTDSSYPRKYAFAFLDNVHRKFKTTYGSNPDKAMPFAINAEFALVLSAEMKKADSLSGPSSKNSDSGGEENPDKITRLRDEVDQVRDIMVANIDSIMERGERLELLVDKTENLSSSSVTFKNTSRNLSRKMWWQNVKWTVFAIVVVILILYLIVGAACGGATLPKCV